MLPLVVGGIPDWRPLCVSTRISLMTVRPETSRRRDSTRHRPADRARHTSPGARPLPGDAWRLRPGNGHADEAMYAAREIGHSYRRLWRPAARLASIWPSTCLHSDRASALLEESLIRAREIGSPPPRTTAAGALPLPHTAATHAGRSGSKAQCLPISRRRPWPEALLAGSRRT